MMVNAARELARGYAMGEITATEAQARAYDMLSPSQSQTFTVNVVETGAAPADVTVTIDLPMAQAALINLPMPLDLMTGNITARVTMRVL